MLTQELDRETKRYLADILAQENTTSDVLIRELIRDRWLSLRHRDLAEPVQSDFGTSTASLHKPRNQKQTIADFVRRKNVGAQIK